MNTDTTFLRRCIGTLELALERIEAHRKAGDVDYDIYRAACVKEFELVLEQSGKLIRKRLVVFFASNREVDRLTFKDLFRFAAKHGVIDAEAVERWIRYRDVRNETAHDFGEQFAEAALQLLPIFLADAKALANLLDAPQNG